MLKYKGQEFENSKNLYNTTKLRPSLLEKAYNNNSLDKVIINRKTGYVDYVDYKNNPAPQLERNPLKQFNKNLKKDIIFSKDFNLVSKGRGRNAVSFDVGRAKAPLANFKDNDLKFYIKSCTYTIGALFSDDYVKTKRNLIFAEPQRLNVQGLIIECINQYINDPYWNFVNVDRTPHEIRLAYGDDIEDINIEIVKDGMELQPKLIDLYIDDIREEYRNVEYTGRYVKVEEDGQYYIRELLPLKLDNYDFYKCQIYEYENPNNINCLVNYINNHFKTKKKYAKSFTFDSIEPTLHDFINWIKKNEYQTAYIFTITGSIVFSQVGKKAEATRKFNNIYMILHNNHAYALKPSENHSVINRLIKMKKEVDTQIIYDDYTSWLVGIDKVLEKGYEPKFISQYIYIHDDKEHIYNEHKINIERFYEHFGLKPNYKLNQSTIFRDLIKLYEIKYESYFPYTYKQTGFNYYNDKFKFNFNHKITIDKYGNDVLYADNILSIDINKCYASCLASLDYIITVNVAYHQMKKYNNEEIIDHYLYIIHGTRSCIYTPDKSMIVSGQYIKFIKDRCTFPFEIIEYVESQKHENKFTTLLEKAYATKDEELMKYLKLAFNIMIGTFQSIGEKTREINKNFSVITNESAKLEAKETMALNDNYMLSYDIEKITEQPYLNNLPISYQIIEKSRMRLIEQLDKMNIAQEDILQVKTDNIVMKNRKKYIKLYKDDPNDFYGWKESKKVILLYECNESLNQNLSFFLDVVNPTSNNNLCLNEDAGGGKSYRIINDVIPKLKGDYMVVSFQHTTLIEYRKNKLNNNTIDHYLAVDEVPRQKHIIVDEFGLLREKHLMWLLMLHYKYKKIIYLYGDNSQLPPAYCELGAIKTEFLKHFCKTYNVTSWKNYRNKFTAEEYNKMKNVTRDDLPYIKELLNKYTVSDIKDANSFIAYRKETINALKQKILKVKNWEFNKDENKITKDIQVINKSNNLKYNGIELYNKQLFNVVSNTDKEIILKDDTDTQITLPIELFWKHFDLGCVQTLYSSQGQTLKNIYYDKKDISFLYNTPKALYTLISRYSN